MLFIDKTVIFGVVVLYCLVAEVLKLHCSTRAFDSKVIDYIVPSTIMTKNQLRKIEVCFVLLF